MTLQEQLQFVQELVKQFRNNAERAKDAEEEGMYRYDAAHLVEVFESLKFLEDIQTIVQNQVK